MLDFRKLQISVNRPGPDAFGYVNGSGILVMTIRDCNAPMEGIKHFILCSEGSLVVVAAMYSFYHVGAQNCYLRRRVLIPESDSLSQAFPDSHPPCIGVSVRLFCSVYRVNLPQ
jgi:hypothetical protein